jgi:hypothetical protein
MRPLAIEQLIQQLQMLLKHLRCPGKSNDMLRIMLAWAQLGTGMGVPLLHSPEQKVPHLECEWLQSVRIGLASIDARIETVQCFVSLPQREDDTHIMDGLSTCTNFTDTHICSINACQLFLQVTLMSDIATACG